MAAEVLARDLDLPLYRIDLSQVVNKYIGETEKNLKRVFDACERSDLILLFDEADAIFGKRTQVRDAHDRYANLEISYLLGRMEKAKGLTILATNRKEDLDDAFLRRLRYVVDFPVPGPQERRRIWDLCIPDGVDGSGVDCAFLADRFPLSGGHIRSATFNALLQSAGRSDNGERQLHMEDVLVAVWRELRKANRSVSPESFGQYASLVSSVETGGGP
jgi:vesicle-fusing ATPase